MTTSQIQVEEGLARGGALRDVATRQEVADFTRISYQTLARWASEREGKGPRFRKAGGRVLYMRDDVLAWLESLADAS